VTDGFVGAAPDIGAFELGGTIPHFGPRTDATVPNPPTNLTVQ
jgi:hypothetical protein